MLISDNEVKCRLSEGCFFALGSYSKYHLRKVSEEDDYGHDFELRKLIERNGSHTDVGSILDFQLKCTTKWEDNGNDVKYSLRSKNYNDIVQRNLDCSTPLILILMCLPSNDPEWVQVSENQIIFRENLYWYHTTSKEMLQNEDSSKTIYIPKQQKINVNTLQDLVINFGIKINGQR